MYTNGKRASSLIWSAVCSFPTEKAINYEIKEYPDTSFKRLRVEFFFILKVKVNGVQKRDS